MKSDPRKSGLIHPDIAAHGKKIATEFGLLMVHFKPLFDVHFRIIVFLLA